MPRTKRKAITRNFAQADEVRTFPNGRLELLKLGNSVVGRATLEPGWKWSESVKPIVHTDSCQAPHFQYQVAGVLKVVMDDGSELETRAGDLTSLPVGHDAWVVGNEPVVVVDFQGMAEYAQAIAAKQRPRRATTRPRARARQR